jgi:hypothetical protein
MGLCGFGIPLGETGNCTCNARVKPLATIKEITFRGGEEQLLGLAQAALQSERFSCALLARCKNLDTAQFEGIASIYMQ